MDRTKEALTPAADLSHDRHRPNAGNAARERNVPSAKRLLNDSFSCNERVTTACSDTVRGIREPVLLRQVTNDVVDIKTGECCQPAVGDVALRSDEVQGRQPLDQCDVIESMGAEKRIDEGQILGSTGDELGNAEVVAFEAKSGLAVGVRRLEANESGLPSGRQGGGRGVDAIAVDPMCSVKRGVFAQHTFDLCDSWIMFVLCADRPEIGLVRERRRTRQLLLRDRGVDRLAADHDDLVVASQFTGCPNEMLEFSAPHCSPPAAVRR